TMTIRLPLCLVILSAVSCVEVDSRWDHCVGTARICPERMVCDIVNDRCSEPNEPCLNLGDGERCTVGGGDGGCKGGVCGVVPGPRCGDGKIDPGEDCEGADLNGFTCLTVPEHFYEEPGLRCNDSCKFDTSQCVGSCQDRRTSGPEVCDPTDPE